VVPAHGVRPVRGLEPGELFLGQLEPEGGDRIGEVLAPGRADDRGDDSLPGEQPGEGHLRGRHAVASPLFHDQVHAYCGTGGFRPRVVMEGADIETQLGLVSAAIGISPQPASFAGLQRRGVVFRPLADPPESTVQLAWPGSPVPRLLPAVIELAHTVTGLAITQLRSVPA
jgi:DNA-binding transcriptional LysR family regulator